MLASPFKDDNGQRVRHIHRAIDSIHWHMNCLTALLQNRRGNAMPLVANDKGAIFWQLGVKQADRVAGQLNRNQWRKPWHIIRQKFFVGTHAPIQ